MSFTIKPGRSFPLGATVYPEGVNFSVFAKGATGVEFLLFGDVDSPRPEQVISLDPRQNRTYHYWHVFVPGVKAGQIYGYRVAGPWAPERGTRFDHEKVMPEVPFKLEGLLQALEERLAQRGHAVIAVAEGAGQDLLAQTSECDASGNVRYGDIGIFLRDRIKEHFSQTGRKVELKYIDPSYTIRSLPANAWDSAFCLLLGQYAVHAGMAGRTDMIVAYWNHQETHVPISLAVSKRKQLDPEGWIWNSVLAITGQPRHLV